MADEAKAARRILGSRLIPDLSIPKREIALTRYWFGLLPDCPVDPIHVGYVTFAKIMELVSIGPGGETIRNPMIGCCAALQRAHIEQLVKTLPRLIIRFQDRIIGKMQTDGVTEDMEAPAEPEVMRIGHVIRIPTDDEVEFHKKAGTYQPYIPIEEDKPAADYLFLVKQDMRGGDYPAPLSQTGIELPPKE